MLFLLFPLGLLSRPNYLLLLLLLKISCSLLSGDFFVGFSYPVFRFGVPAMSMRHKNQRRAAYSSFTRKVRPTLRTRSISAPSAHTPGSIPGHKRRGPLPLHFRTLSPSWDTNPSFGTDDSSYSSIPLVDRLDASHSAR